MMFKNMESVILRLLPSKMRAEENSEKNKEHRWRTKMLLKFQDLGNSIFSLTKQNLF